MFRSEVIARTALWPYAGVPYSQTQRWQGRYRQDCSGFVSMCWATGMDGPGAWGGYSTETLVSQGIMKEINASELKPGDAIGICGPGSAGNNGHIMLFEAWYNHDPGDNRCWIWEQAGGVNGPRRRLINYPFGSYRSWRAFYVVDDPGAFLRRVWPSYMGANDYFGLITGPVQSHGGYVVSQRPDIKAIQQRLIALGYVPSITDPNSSWADGIFGPNTKAAVSLWQSTKYAQFTTRYGEVWQDDWERLFTY